MKFGALIAKGSPKRFGYGAIIKKFSTWRPWQAFFKMAASNNCFLMSDGYNIIIQAYLCMIPLYFEAKQ